VGSTPIARLITIVGTALIVVACSRTERLPASIYDGENAGGYERLSPQLQSTEVNLLYLTDREPEHDDKGNLRYGVGRSQSLAFGSVVVELDENRSWDELVEWTRSEGPGDPVPVPEIVSVTELGRFPDTPFPLVVDDFGHVVSNPEVREQHARTRDIALGELRRRLALSDRKVVWVSVHGVQTGFEEGARFIAMAWHQRGRWGVPIYYSWPAGQSGFISGYSYDRESGEFTIFHLKQFLRALGRVPEVEKINLHAHSRGTDGTRSGTRSPNAVQHRPSRADCPGYGYGGGYPAHRCRGSGPRRGAFDVLCEWGGSGDCARAITLQQQAQNRTDQPGRPDRRAQAPSQQSEERGYHLL